MPCKGFFLFLFCIGKEFIIRAIEDVRMQRVRQPIVILYVIMWKAIHVIFIMKSCRVGKELKNI